ncbi:hypothetical protein NECAME_02429 [Necator americanus]|uniref:Uncharacterized protein n=1 Tax=Necator americanus TaxID=51031 RepID=W2TH23_NECAM|nr:hypothetical protein NECAME_02429 [Necator americanus]ETN80297.1 hypothetical protein NECAME_02429 [Necator americanus]
MPVQDEMDYLPQGLAAHPMVQRRASVFHDLITVFRKNTVARIGRSTSDPHKYSRDHIRSGKQVRIESDAFLGKTDHRDDADEDGKPLTRQDDYHFDLLTVAVFRPFLSESDKRKKL